MVRQIIAVAHVIERRLGAAATALQRVIMGERPPAYNPAKYYMRGPGPKWAAKHGVLHTDTLAARRSI